jgi:hypothetical protein
MEPGAMQETEAPINQEEQVDPKVQEQFDLLVINGMNIINEEKPARGIVGKIKQSQNKVQAVAEITVDIIGRLADSALESKVEIAKEALVQAANVLMGEIITLAETAGVEPFSDDEKAQSFQVAVSLYLDSAVKQGKITKEELAELGEEAKQSEQGQEMAGQIENRQQPQSQQPPVPDGNNPQQQGGGILTQGGM